MDMEEFIFIRYKDNVIIVSDMCKKLYNDFGFLRDDSIRVINRIFDYQRNRYGDILDMDRTKTYYSMEELHKMGYNARIRKYHKLRKEK